METVTNHVAGAAIVSPWWLPALHNGVEYALPFLGSAWIIMQMYFKIKDRYFNARPDKAD